MIEDIEAREKVATSADRSASTVEVIHQWWDNADRYSASTLAENARRDIPYLLAQLRDREEKLEVEEKWREAKHTCPVDYCCWGAALAARDRILKGGD